MKPATITAATATPTHNQIDRFLAEFPGVPSLWNPFHTNTSVCLFYLTLVSIFPILPHTTIRNVSYRDELVLLVLLFFILGYQKDKRT